MQKLMHAMVIFISTLLLLGCVSSQNQALPSVPSPPAPPTLVGGDKDAHGCIGSAGYAWCEKKGKCLRPWEENCTAAPALIGGDRDSHGCISSAGYVWCNVIQYCIRPWETNCSADALTNSQMPGSGRDSHGCIGSAGYSWCAEKEKCIRGWEEPCTLADRAKIAQKYCNDTRLSSVMVSPVHILLRAVNQSGITLITDNGTRIFCNLTGDFNVDLNATLPLIAEKPDCLEVTTLSSVGPTLVCYPSPRNDSLQIMPGSDRDSHGCIGSAGYSWCEEKGKCMREWEENCTAAPALVGGDKDVHGCIPSAGYSWCCALQACIQPWQTSCSVPLIGGDKDTHGCYTAAGYAWCGAKQKCLRSWEENCTSPG